MRTSAESAEVVDNQKLSGLAGNDLPQRLAARELSPTKTDTDFSIVLRPGTSNQVPC